MTASKPYLVDSSGWLEYVTEDAKVDLFAPYIEGEQPVIVPTIVIFEVYKRLKRELDELTAQQFVSQAHRNRVVVLDEYLAIGAADLSLQHKLPMADAVIYATALSHGAELITADQHFAGLPDVTVL